MSEWFCYARECPLCRRPVVPGAVKTNHVVSNILDALPQSISSGGHKEPKADAQASTPSLQPEELFQSAEIDAFSRYILDNGLLDGYDLDSLETGAEHDRRFLRDVVVWYREWKKEERMY